MLERNAMMYLCLKLQFAAVVINCAAPLQLENQMGFRDLEIEGRAGPGGDSDFMAGGGNRPGPASDVRHQPPGDAHQQRRINTAQNSILYQCSQRSGLRSTAVCMRPSVRVQHSCIFCYFLYTRKYQYILVYTSIYQDILVYTIIPQYILIFAMRSPEIRLIPTHPAINRLIQTYTTIYRLVLCYGMRRYEAVHPGTYRLIPPQNVVRDSRGKLHKHSIQQHLPIHTSIYYYIPVQTNFWNFPLESRTTF